MKKFAKGSLSAMIVACALACSVVTLSDANAALGEGSSEAEVVMEISEGGQDSSAPDSGLVTIEDEEIPMATGKGANLTKKQRAKIEDKVISLVNSARTKAGKSKLKESSKLAESSEIRAKELPKSFSHTRPNGTSWTTTFTKVGIKVSTVYSGENLAMKKTTAKASYSDSDITSYAKGIHTSLMNSSGHKKNIVSGNFKTIGVSVCSSVGGDGRLGIYLVQHFCSK